MTAIVSFGQDTFAALHSISEKDKNCKSAVVKMTIKAALFLSVLPQNYLTPWLGSISPSLPASFPTQNLSASHKKPKSYSQNPIDSPLLFNYNSLEDALQVLLRSVDLTARRLKYTYSGSSSA
jgi:hypothetical protein